VPKEKEIMMNLHPKILGICFTGPEGGEHWVLREGAEQKWRFALEYGLFLKSLNPIRRIKELAQELRRAPEQRDQALQDKQRLENENARLREEIERLQKELEAAQRVGRPGACG
jgi:hypothetical protein